MTAASRPGPPAALQAQWSALRARWLGLGARERRLVGVALLVLAAFLVWSVGLQPALRTLREAPVQLDALDAQTQAMRLLAAETQELRNAAPLSAEQSAEALRAATDLLGNKARLSLQGNRAVLTLNGVSSAQLIEWLTEAREGARARPAEAQLSRGAQGFNGSIVLNIGGGG